MIHRTVTLLEEAVEDIREARDFYESLESGVGSYFVRSILIDIETLRQHSGIHPIHLGFHRLLAKRFPFAIYYEVEPDKAKVAAVLDLRRDPAWIRKDLESRSG